MCVSVFLHLFRDFSLGLIVYTFPPNRVNAPDISASLTIWRHNRDKRTKSALHKDTEQKLFRVHSLHRNPATHSNDLAHLSVMSAQDFFHVFNQTVDLRLRGLM